MTSTETTTTDRERTTVTVRPSTKHALFRLKERQADTFDDVIQRLIEHHDPDEEDVVTPSDLGTENSSATSPRESDGESRSGLVNFT